MYTLFQNFILRRSKSRLPVLFSFSYTQFSPWNNSIIIIKKKLFCNLTLEWGIPYHNWNRTVVYKGDNTRKDFIWQTI